MKRLARVQLSYREYSSTAVQPLPALQQEPRRQVKSVPDCDRPIAGKSRRYKLLFVRAEDTPRVIHLLPKGNSLTSNWL
jgi:hypothetical protein